jgi:pheromone shutdown protein TraB
MMRLFNPDGVDVTVSALFKEWIDKADLPDRQSKIYADFAKMEVEERLRSYKEVGSRWRTAQVAIWTLIAALGLLGAALAVTESQHTIAVIAGGLVATLTAFTSAAHPGRQADGYEIARLKIRDQAWDLLIELGDYENLKTDEKRFEMFAVEIRNIVHRKRTATQFQLS